MNPYHKQELGVDYVVAKSVSSMSIAKVSRLVAQSAQQIILLLHGTEKWMELVSRLSAHVQAKSILILFRKGGMCRMADLCSVTGEIQNRAMANA